MPRSVARLRAIMFCASYQAKQYTYAKANTAFNKPADVANTQQRRAAIIARGCYCTRTVCKASNFCISCASVNLFLVCLKFWTSAVNLLWLYLLQSFVLFCCVRRYFTRRNFLILGVVCLGALLIKGAVIAYGLTSGFTKIVELSVLLQSFKPEMPLLMRFFEETCYGYLIHNFIYEYFFVYVLIFIYTLYLQIILIVLLVTVKNVLVLLSCYSCLVCCLVVLFSTIFTLCALADHALVRFYSFKLKNKRKHIEYRKLASLRAHVIKFLIVSIFKVFDVMHCFAYLCLKTVLRLTALPASWLMRVSYRGRSLFKAVRDLFVLSLWAVKTLFNTNNLHAALYLSGAYFVLNLVVLLISCLSGFTISMWFVAALLLCQLLACNLWLNLAINPFSGPYQTTTNLLNFYVTQLQRLTDENVELLQCFLKVYNLTETAKLGDLRKYSLTLESYTRVQTITTYLSTQQQLPIKAWLTYAQIKDCLRLCVGALDVTKRLAYLQECRVAECWLQSQLLLVHNKKLMCSESCLKNVQWETPVDTYLYYKGFSGVSLRADEVVILRDFLRVSTLNYDFMFWAGLVNNGLERDQDEKNVLSVVLETAWKQNARKLHSQSWTEFKRCKQHWINKGRHIFVLPIVPEFATFEQRLNLVYKGLSLNTYLSLKLTPLKSLKHCSATLSSVLQQYLQKNRSQLKRLLDELALTLYTLVRAQLQRKNALLAVADSRSALLMRELRSFTRLLGQPVAFLKQLTCYVFDVKALISKSTSIKSGNLFFIAVGISLICLLFACCSVLLL